MTSTTMVLLILVDVTWPILVLRRLCFVVVSAIYFFLALLAVFFAAGLALALRLVFVATATAPGSAAAASDFSTGAAAPWGRAMPNCFSRITVWMRATS